MRPIQFIAPALIAVALGGCEPQATVETGASQEPPPIAPDIEMAGVPLDGDISILGNEPFWNVTMTADRVTYGGPDRPTQTAARQEAVVVGTTAEWEYTTTAGNALHITVMDTPCSDGMSDRTYPLTARVEIGDEVLNGCAISTAVLHATDETGQPREPAPAAGDGAAPPRS